MEVYNFLLTFFVWGMEMLLVIFNVEAGNYYSKSTFIMTLIKQEKLVFIIRDYLCVFTKLFTGTWVSEDFKFWIFGSRNNRKCTDLTVTENYWLINAAAMLI